MPDMTPSEVLRTWMPEQVCQESLRIRYPDGRIEYCGLGVLGAAAQIDWGGPSRIKDGVEFWDQLRLYDEIARFWGLESATAFVVAMRSDRRGILAAAEYLESLGK